MEVNGFRIVYVDSDENISSLMERIRKIPVNTCLVIHDSSPIFFDQKQIERLKMIEIELDIELALITGRNLFVKKILRRGLTVYRSFQDFQEGNPEEPLVIKGTGRKHKVDGQEEGGVGSTAEIEADISERDSPSADECEQTIRFAPEEKPAGGLELVDRDIANDEADGDI
ncbi:MAG: hypothetical protein UMV23_07135, partial [Halanaerobium sp.]|nr:hypothetical protein [Halanaerobium sp.]